MQPEKPISLSRLPHRQRSRIVRVGGDDNPAVNDTEGSLEHRLLDLGFEEGAVVEIRHQGIFGGPLAVQVSDRLIALRPTDAAVILVDSTHDTNSVP
jgi:Fe2+ transport system protein FeoA